jgi:hypothetical protein
MAYPFYVLQVATPETAFQWSPPAEWSSIPLDTPRLTADRTPPAKAAVVLLGNLTVV